MNLVQRPVLPSGPPKLVTRMARMVGGSIILAGENGEKVDDVVEKAEEKSLENGWRNLADFKVLTVETDISEC